MYSPLALFQGVEIWELRVRNRKAVRLVFVFLGLVGVCPFAGAQDVSVAISDDVIVLDAREKSGLVELVNFAAVPAEYNVRVLSLPDGIAAGDRLIRWAPRRAVVPANRTIPLRVVARPRGDLAPGEYVVRVGIQARGTALPDSEVLDGDTEGENVDNGLGVSVPIQPILPTSVYYRHEIEAPRIEITGYTSEVESGAEGIGAFLTKKEDVDLSFVGSVSITHEPSGVILRQGRMHVPPGREPGPLLIPFSDEIPDMASDDEYCLRIWSEFPPRGEPYTERCS